MPLGSHDPGWTIWTIWTNNSKELTLLWNASGKAAILNDNVYQNAICSSHYESLVVIWQVRPRILDLIIIIKRIISWPNWWSFCLVLAEFGHWILRNHCVGDRPVCETEHGDCVLCMHVSAASLRLLRLLWKQFWAMPPWSTLFVFIGHTGLARTKRVVPASSTRGHLALQCASASGSYQRGPVNARV